MFLKLPLDIGDTRCRFALELPALNPKIVTKLGSPPKCAILSLTHFKATTWSFSPLFPGASSSPVLIKPRKVVNQEYKKIKKIKYPKTPIYNLT